MSYPIKFPPEARGSAPTRFTLYLLCAFAMLVLAPSNALAAQQLYTCGMHPQVIKTEPGDCPICHMKLTPIVNAGGSTAGMAGAAGISGGAAAQLATITIDPGIIQRMNLKTQEVRREAAQRQVRTVGVVAFDERSEREITTRYEGWIEKLFANASWQRVEKGDPLFEIYSPALYNAQLNYLLALRSQGEQGEALTTAALERLRLLGVGDDFIDTLRASGKAERNYIYRAPADGVVVEKRVREGQMIAAGQAVYSFASLSPVWVLAQVYEKDLPLVKAGQTAYVRSSYNEGPLVFKGEVAEILPQVQDATRAAIARIILDNPEESLLPGMFTDVRFVASLGDSVILVPDEAVLRSGEKNRVFVALGNGRFEPREVELGSRTDDHRYVVQSGLQAGDAVVVSGQFMLDSESRLREAIAKMINAATGESATPDAATAAHLAAGHTHGDSGHAHSAVGDSGAAHRQSANTAHADHACCSAEGETASPEQMQVASPEQVKIASQKREQLRRSPLVVLAFAAADAASILAADDFTAYKEHLPTLQEALKIYVVQSQADAGTPEPQIDARNPRLQSGTGDSQPQPSGGDPLAAALANAAFTAPQTIAQARDAFAPFSNALAQNVVQANLHKSGVIYVFECPMVPKVGVGRWLQRENTDVWNPFFGADMLHCGGVAQ